MSDQKFGKDQQSSFPAQPPRAAYPTVDYFNAPRLVQQPRDLQNVPTAPSVSTFPVSPPPSYPYTAGQTPYPAGGGGGSTGEKHGYGPPTGSPAVYGQVPGQGQYSTIKLPLHGAPKKPQESGMFQPPPPKVTPPARSNKKALIIGCNYRGTSYELQGCIHDCAHIDYMLKTEFGFKKENIRMLTDDGAGFAMPTKSNIFSSIAWLVTDLQPGDSLFFHFSGHGSQKPDPIGDERDGLNETLLPCDFKQHGQIIDDEINERLVNLLPKGVYLHAVIDACHSGTAMDLEYYTKYKSNGDIEWRCEGPTVKYKGTSGGVAILFSACADHQVAQDTDGLSGSVYTGAATNAFIDAIVSIGPNLSYAQVLQHMHMSMAKLAGKSAPAHSIGGKIMEKLANGLMSAMGISTQTPQISSNIQLNLNDRLRI